ncbi:MAG TPA: acyl-ACP--UDP-N-acetylglucosamine O-acyltransferase [Blastocatellia bacterium]|nr:acyl-ACP--UDP-N-acetylglucosamine O-acyltransferase [Blastocatellia bacterium]
MSIHPSAIVDEGAKLGSEITVGPYSVIEADTEIGNCCEIRSHATVKRYTFLGPSSVLYEGAVAGGEPQDVGFKGVRSYVRIGARNRIREGATIHRGTMEDSATEIGSDCYIMVCAHVAHNCHLGDGVILANNVALAGHVDVGDGAFLSGGVVVHQFCQVGQLAMIGGNSKIVQDCLPFIITDGNPGRARGLNQVGLRRAGISAKEIHNLKSAYRLLLRSGLKLETALDEMTGIESQFVDHLVGFVRGSKRGFCHSGD